MMARSEVDAMVAAAGIVSGDTLDTIKTKLATRRQSPVAVATDAQERNRVRFLGMIGMWPTPGLGSTRTPAPVGDEGPRAGDPVALQAMFAKMDRKWWPAIRSSYDNGIEQARAAERERIQAAQPPKPKGRPSMSAAEKDGFIKKVLAKVRGFAAADDVAVSSIIPRQSASTCTDEQVRAVLAKMPKA